MRTALGWRHRIWVKELWAAETDDDDAQAREVAPEVAKRILALADRIGGLGRLAMELRDIADRFEDIPHTTGPADAFNGLLEELYDLGDEFRVAIC